MRRKLPNFSICIIALLSLSTLYPFLPTPLLTYAFTCSSDVLDSVFDRKTFYPSQHYPPSPSIHHRFITSWNYTPHYHNNVRSMMMMTSSSHGNPSDTTKNLPTEEDDTQPVLIQVCGFKDCKRVGGGKKLVQLFQTALEESTGLPTAQVELCDCQGECGYGPNVLVQGQLYNQVKDTQNVQQILSLLMENKKMENESN